MEANDYYQIITLMQNEIQTYTQYVIGIATLIVVIVTVTNIWMFNSAVNRKLIDQKDEFNAIIKKQEIEFKKKFSETKESIIYLHVQDALQMAIDADIKKDISSRNKFIEIAKNFAKDSSQAKNMIEVIIRTFKN